VLFERLASVQFKYHGNAQANITEDDLVAQAVQPLPVVYNLTARQNVSWVMPLPLMHCREQWVIIKRLQ
jgi:hypothetical protein